MKQFTRYMAGLSWEIEAAVMDTEKRDHCFEVSREVINENDPLTNRQCLKITFEEDEST